jgi:hypothetical protein
VARANDELRAEAATSKQRIAAVEQENRRLSAANGVVKQEVEEVSDCCLKVRKDLMNLERELAQMKEEIITMKEKQVPLVGEVGQLKEASKKLAAKMRHQFPPSLKKGKQFDLPDGIIAHVTRKCGRNMHDCHVVDVTSGSFERETNGANPHSGTSNHDPDCAAKNAADLEIDSVFFSAYRNSSDNIPHTRNNWVHYDFKDRRIVPMHYTIPSYGHGLCHLRLWLVETSVDGESWREVTREEDNKQLNGRPFTGTFTAAGGGECRFIRLVNIGNL